MELQTNTQKSLLTGKVKRVFPGSEIWIRVLAVWELEWYTAVSLVCQDHRVGDPVGTGVSRLSP